MTYQHDTFDRNLNNLHHAMEYRDDLPHLRVTLGSDNITITGDVNILDNIRVNNSAEQSIPVYLTETGTVSITGPVGITGPISITGPVSVTGSVKISDPVGITGPVSVTGPIGITGPVGITGTVSVTGTFWQTTQQVSVTGPVAITGPVGITGPVSITGTVSVSTTNVINVIVNEDPGTLYAFNNHAANANRGWTMDDTMRPVVSFQNGSADAADIIKIVEYEIGNNNANQSTIIYEWYEGPLTISGAAIPAWTTFGIHSQYRVYQDKYSSNQSNTFTVPNGNGTYLRHNGVIIGKNTSGDEGPASLYGGSSRNMLTLCMRRVDNATKLDVWFAFTIKELS